MSVPTSTKIGILIDFPDADKAIATSVALHKLTGIHFTISPVVDIERFDTLVGDVKDI